MILRLVIIVIVAIPVSRAFRPLDPAFVQEWADAHALTITPVNRPLVEHYLATARKLRTLGAVAGLFLAPLLVWAVGAEGGRANLFWILPGYLLGALYAELALNRPLDAKRAAALTPRHVADYLPQRLLLAQRTAGVLCALGGVVVAMSGLGQESASDGALLAPATIGTALAIGLELIERHIVRRPQPVVAPDLLAADDAIRSQSVHSVAGSGVAMLLLAAGAVPFAVAQSTDEPLRGLLSLAIVLLSFVGPFVAWLYYGHRAWRVRRAPVVGAPA